MSNSKYKPRQFESTGHYKDKNGKTRTDTSANIYESMLLSSSFQTLNTRQKILYIYCKAQFFGKRKPKQDYPDAGFSESCFYFSWKDIQNYGLYAESDHSTFYKDMNVLCDKGFLERVASGKKNRHKTIYRYSSKWSNNEDENV